MHKESRLTTMFFRNDDVRGKLDKSLVEITNLFVDNQIPITHAIEPANVTPDVVEWLLSKKKENPHLIEIMQHGYDHTIKNLLKKGEFGGQRTYSEQFSDIKAGKRLMNNYFGTSWFRCFNFPYAPYNPAAIKAVDDLNFDVISSHYNSSISRRLFYCIGHLLKKGYFLNHHVSWNLQRYPNTSLFEIDMNFGFIKRYYDEMTSSLLMSLEEMINATIQYQNQKTIGVLIHHRYHNTTAKIKLVEDYILWAKEQSFEFSTMQSVFEKYDNQ